jgi:tetratricopeptide (TPR) repeat protein
MNNHRSFLLLLLCVCGLYFIATDSLNAADTMPVKVWEEDVVIPTYLAGPPDPNPMFYFGRAYQGAEGRVYPYPLYDKLTGKKVDKTYKMVYLENEYVKIGVLPEIGGRIFSAVDKTNNYNFFYGQHVVKPALIGMIGAWISGGVEWNIPHHHRTTSWLPSDYRMDENLDGSKTVWVGELELRHRMRWAVGLTLYPGKSYLETSVRVLNRTPVVNSFLCFANVAVHVNEDYQVIFPPSTQHVTYHAKREFTTWPIATTKYNGSDFSNGVDVSWYKNHIQSNSMFAWNYEDDFFAGYDHGKHAGTMSVADHHVVPGKKLWTWGSGPGGRLWDKILTDDDGPYIELMVGAYSDNQPDYSWIQPYEVKKFKQYWYPFRDIDGVKNANLEAAVNLDVSKDRVAKLGFYTTAAHAGATATLKAGDKILLEEKIDIAPGKAYVKEVSLPGGVDQYGVRASLSADGHELVAYSPVKREEELLPKPVKPPLEPQDIKTNEELYLTGLRIDQFHNPSLEPDPYWEEALNRDPGDVRVNTAMGIQYIKRARFGDAEKCLRKALERLTDKYTSPKDGEAFYYLGVALKAQGKNDAAYDNFYKATWSAAWQAAGYYSLAEIACLRHDLPTALEHLDRALELNAMNTRAINLKAAVLRHMGQTKQAFMQLGSVKKIDPLDVHMIAEYWLAEKASAPCNYLRSILQDSPAVGLETAVEYANAGFWDDGSAILMQMIEIAPDKEKISPLVYYYLGYFAEKQGQEDEASKYYQLGSKMPPDFVFPFQAEAIPVLQRAMQVNPNDARAPYYLANILYDWQPEEAIKLWEKSASMDDKFPIVHRNLASAYSRQEKGIDKAIAELEKAVSLSDNFPIHFFELDQLYETAGTAPEKRLAVLENHHPAVLQRDDALSREIGLKVFMGKYDEAIELMTGRQFNVWEGGARFGVYDSWTDAHLLRGHQNFAAKKYPEALADYQAAVDFPKNLQVAKTRRGGRVQEAAYWIASAYEVLGDQEKAKTSFQEAAAEVPHTGQDDVLPASDRTVLTYYRAMALKKLGENEKAAVIFKQLVTSGDEMVERRSGSDFFSKFGERQSQRSRLASAHYIAGLGYLGLGEFEKAKEDFSQALKAKPDHLGAKIAMENIK